MHFLTWKVYWSLGITQYILLFFPFIFQFPEWTSLVGRVLRLQHKYSLFIWPFRMLICILIFSKLNYLSIRQYLPLFMVLKNPSCVRIVESEIVSDSDALNYGIDWLDKFPNSNHLKDSHLTFVTFSFLVSHFVSREVIPTGKSFFALFTK